MKNYILGSLLAFAIVFAGGIGFSGTAYAMPKCDSGATAPTSSCSQSNGGSCVKPYTCVRINGAWCWATGASCDPGTLAAGQSSGNILTPITGLNPLITWSVVPGATSYNVQVSESPSFASLVANKTAVVGNSTRIYPSTVAVTAALKPYTVHFFRVQAVNAFGASDWSGTFDFTTGGLTTSVAGILCPPGTPPSTQCPSVSAPEGGFTSENIFSLLYSAGARWTRANGQAVSPKQVNPRLDYYDETGAQIFISGGDSLKVTNLINTLVGGRQ